MRGSPLRPGDRAASPLRRVAEGAIAITAIALVGLAALTLVTQVPTRNADPAADSILPPAAAARLGLPLPTGEDWAVVAQRLLDVAGRAVADDDPPLLLAVVDDACACEDELTELLGPVAPRTTVTAVHVVSGSRRPDEGPREVRLRLRFRERRAGDTGLGGTPRRIPVTGDVGDGEDAARDLPSPEDDAATDDGLLGAELFLRRVDRQAAWQLVELEVLDPGAPLEPPSSP